MSSRTESVPRCSLCGELMVWAFAEKAWETDGYGCSCEEEPTEYGECLCCGGSGPIGGGCEDCNGEIGS